jgi:hypothetical protein
VALVEALGADANAILQEPAAAPPAGPGRPHKVIATGEADQLKPKRPRGRPPEATSVAGGMVGSGRR